MRSDWDEDRMRKAFQSEAVLAELEMKACKAKIKNGGNKAFYENAHDEKLAEWFVCHHLAGSDALESADDFSKRLHDMKNYEWPGSNAFDRERFKTSVNQLIDRLIANAN